jgi:hypothetical protein
MRESKTKSVVFCFAVPVWVNVRVLATCASWSVKSVVTGYQLLLYKYPVWLFNDGTKVRCMHESAFVEGCYWTYLAHSVSV